MRLIVFGHDEASTRIFIEPVDDAWPCFASDSGQGGAMVKQSVNERVFGVAGSRMNNKAGRLVQDDEVIVFEQDVERDVFRPESNRPRGRLIQFDQIACLHNPWRGLVIAPLSLTNSSRINCCSRDREYWGARLARKRSRRVPAASAGTSSDKVELAESGIFRFFLSGLPM